MNEIETPEPAKKPLKNIINSRSSFINSKAFSIISLFFIFIIILVVYRCFSLEGFEAFLRKNIFLGSVLSILVYTILGITIIPSEPITVLLATLVGPLTASFLATIGNTLSAFVEYFIGHGVADLADFETKKDSLPFGLGKLPADSPVFLLLARSIPGFGPKFVSIAAGIYKVKLFTYLWTTLVSNAFGAFFVSYAGFEILSII